MKKLSVFLASLLLAGITLVQAQTVRITGTVTSSEDGMPMPGVSVVVKGTTIGATTDVDGKYELAVPANAQTLTFSFVGYETQDIAVAGRSVIDVVMKPESKQIEEVIVTGYTTRGKNQITGSTVQVKADAIKNMPVLSVDQALQGKVAGMTISTSSGTPGAIQDIRIRGVGSLTATNQPLFVIDGVPVVSGDFSGSDARSSLSALASLNNSDIESMTILKDASATAAYGARGSNGVIVITTKKGKQGKTQFNLTSYYGFQNRAVEGRKQLSASQRAELLLESIWNTYSTYIGDQSLTEDWARANYLLDDYDAWVAAGRPDNNWDKAVMNTNAPTQNITLSANGGDEVSSFYASLGYNKTESIIVGTEFKRWNAALNYNRQLTKSLKLSTSNSFSNTFQDGLILEQSAYFANPILARYFMPAFYSPYDASGKPTLTPNPYNYLYLKDHDITYNDLSRFITNSSLEWTIIKDLKYKTQFAIDYITTAYKNYQNPVYGDQDDEGGSTFQSESKNYNLVTQNSLSYNLNVNDHNVSVMALLEFQKNRYDFLSAYGERFAGEGITNINVAPANRDASSYMNDWYQASYLGMVNYSYASKYIADFTYRYEGSSRFAPGYRFGNFWSLGAAWNINREEFMSGTSEWIDNLRLRASYGISGNNAIGLNSFATLIYYDEQYGNTGAGYPVNFGNSKLTWEKNKTFDVGIDFGFLKNFITGQFSYYNKVTYDLLQSVPLSATSGHSSDLRNAGEVLNRGFEGILTFNFIQKKDFNLNLSLNFATLYNEVLKLAKYADGSDITVKTGTTMLQVGKPIRAWHMRKWAGVDPQTGLPQWYLNGKDGDVTNNYYDPNIVEEFQGGSAIPTYSGGFNFHVDYKGVYFDLGTYFAGGHKVYEDWSFYTHHSGYYPTYLYGGVADLMRRWQKPGDVTDYPKQLFDGTGNNASRTSSRFLYDGDYLRVKDIVLGYNLPKTIVTKVGLDAVSVYARGTNLFTWVKDSGLKYDPEVRADGFTRLTNPPIKSITFGVNINF